MRRPLGPIFRLQSGEADRQRRLRRLDRWASEWDVDGRPRHLLLRGRLLGEAKELTRGTVRLSKLAKAYLRRSRRRVFMLRALIVLLVVGVAGGVTLAVTGFERWLPEEPEPVAVEATEAEPVEVEVEPVAPPPAKPVVAWVEHAVIPAETLDDIARRYDVAVANVARWNGLNVDDPQFEVGQRLRIKPKKNPLPQQQIEFELDKRYDWKKLAKRFEVEVEKLRAYNPEVDKLTEGTRVSVWINPKPYKRRTEVLDVPRLDIRDDAHSVGRPNNGRLVHGIQMPKSTLYKRRAPFIMWGSSHTIETLHTAIAKFRQDLEWDGVLVVADISKQGGGKFPPHASHQAGRDVDVWMPVLKGVYKRNHLGKDRKPRPNEIDWFATWGLVRALIESKKVVHIFLEYSLQAKLYHAAKTMGATDAELKKAMQYPRGTWAPGIVGHSAGHIGHIHVRFKCGPADSQCGNDVARSGE